MHIITGIIAVLIGLGGGYVIGTNQSPTPQDMNTVMHGMTTGLEGRVGDDFDKAFIAEMILHHEGAVEMARSALSQARHEEIKNMANEIIAAQTREIEQMREWQRTWYGQ